MEIFVNPGKFKFPMGSAPLPNEPCQKVSGLKRQNVKIGTKERLNRHQILNRFRLHRPDDGIPLLCRWAKHFLFIEENFIWLSTSHISNDMRDCKVDDLEWEKIVMTQGFSSHTSPRYCKLTHVRISGHFGWLQPI